MTPPGLEQPELGVIITGGQSRGLRWEIEIYRKKMALAQDTSNLFIFRK